MRYTIHTAPQGTPEWLAARAGRVTGSRASDVLAKIKSGEAAARRDYRAQLLAERLTGSPESDGFTNAAMQWGTETEPIARMAYESLTGNIVRETGFLACDDMSVGCSLDGDVSDMRGIIEIKCPKTSTHIDTFLAGKLPSKHMPQITHNLWVSGAEWCDFVTFDPRLHENLQIMVVRITRADCDISAYESEVKSFLSELDEMEKKLRARMA